MKTNGKYILKGRRVYKEPDLEKWARWIEDAELNRIVGRTKVGKLTVSTVFLGLDHNFRDKGKPILFETMVLPDHPDFMEQYSTYKEAEEGHARIVQTLKLKN